jgi:hypothetical protein
MNFQYSLKFIKSFWCSGRNTFLLLHDGRQLIEIVTTGFNSTQLPVSGGYLGPFYIKQSDIEF